MSETYGEWARLFNWLGTTGLSCEEVMDAITAYQRRKAFEDEQFEKVREEQLSFPLGF